MTEYDAYTNSFRTTDGRIGIANAACFRMWAQGLADTQAIVQNINSGIKKEGMSGSVNTPPIIREKYQKMLASRSEQTPAETLEAGMKGKGTIPVFNFNPLKTDKEKIRRSRSQTPRQRA